MTLSGYFIDLFVTTFRNPKLAAQRLLALDLPVEARWLGLVLVSVLTVIATKLMLATVPEIEVQAWERAWSDPWFGLPVQVISMTLLAAAIALIGRFFGGAGRFEDALVAVVWIQGVMLAPQLVQIVLFPVAPALAGLIAISSVGLFFWMLSNFTCVLHGFRSALGAFFGILGSLLVLAMIIAVLFSVLGVFPYGTGG